MKVLLINHFPLSGSGSGVNTVNVAKSLIKAGHEVCIIVPENQPIEPITGIKQHPVYFNTKELPFNFPCFTTHPRSHTTFYELTDEQYTKYKDAFSNAIEQEIKEFHPDVIHSGHIWTLSALATKYGIPVVIIAHGTDLIGLQQGDERYIHDAEEAYDNSTAIITISTENMNLVKNIFQDDSKVHLVPNGYDSDIFKINCLDKREVLAKYGITKHYEKIVCFAGKFTEIKGIDTLLKACQIYEDEDTLTILAGNGALWEDMKQMATNLQLKNVTFVGNLPPIELQKIFNIANVSAVPSRSEAFGLVAIEAIACGTPIVASREGGLINIINEDVGSLIEKDDHVDLASQISVWLNKKDTIDRAALAAYAKDNYSQDNFTNELCNIYGQGNQKEI